MNNELSSREIEIITNIANGLRSKEIAKFMGISIKTTEIHRENVRRKIGRMFDLNYVGIAEITHFAIARGMIKLRFVQKFPVLMRKR